MGVFYVLVHRGSPFVSLPPLRFVRLTASDYSGLPGYAIYWDMQYRVRGLCDSSGMERKLQDGLLTSVRSPNPTLHIPVDCI